MVFFILLYRLFFPILLTLFWFLSLFNKKIRKGFELRRPNKKLKPWLDFQFQQPPIWFHVASGEYEYAKPIIRELKKSSPQQPILVTYFSPSIEPALRQATDIDFFCPLPWDRSKNWKEFLEQHRPRALLVARTDLWPEMLWQTKKWKIPRLLFSKTVNSKKSFLARWLESPLLGLFSEIFVVSVEDKKNLVRQLGSRTLIEAVGDTRYDQCLHRIQNPRPLKPLNNFQRPLFICGSTWPGDEKVLLPLMEKTNSQISFVVAPHEPTETHLKDMEKKLEQRNLKSQRYSQINDWDPQAILLVDQVGLLADLYQWGQMAFVGGSMDRSVHSVMEPLSLGLLTFVGPNHHNNREALEFSKVQIAGCYAVQIVDGSSSLIEQVHKLQPRWTSEAQWDLQMQVRQRGGASSTVAQWLRAQTQPLA